MKPQAITLLKALYKSPMTTNDIRIELGIGASAQRVKELRDAGCGIETKMVHRKSKVDGHTAIVAEYTLNTIPVVLRKKHNLPVKDQKREAA